MDRRLRRWCDTSLKRVDQGLQANHSQMATAERLRIAERTIELAALLKLAQAKNVLIPVSSSADGGSDDSINAFTLMWSCPSILDLCATGAVFDANGDRFSKSTGGDGATRGALNPDRDTTLRDSCPLIDSSHPEVLASIHEYLVGQRPAEHPDSEYRTRRPQKSGGIFYTPRCVTDYIVEQTLGRWLKDKSPHETTRLAILDPAVGCGAFLLSAYRYLVHWKLKWFVGSRPTDWTSAIVLTAAGWRLTQLTNLSIINNNLFGVDLDAEAIEVAKRILWLAQFDLPIEPPTAASMQDWNAAFERNVRCGNSLTGASFHETPSCLPGDTHERRFDWSKEFPRIAEREGFDLVIGNPPYRRERDFKQELDAVRATTLGRYHSPRMDLWYFFVHRGLELLRPGGRLSFITNAYWTHGTGSEKLITALREEGHLEELFLLQNQPVFPGVSGKHLILRMIKSATDAETEIKLAPDHKALSVDELFSDAAVLRKFAKPRDQLFRDGRLDLWPSSDGFLNKLNRHSRLADLGIVRQGIAENPASINQRTLDRFRNEPSASEWVLGAGVFSLQPTEVERLALTSHETTLLRHYHDLCDLGRYWAAESASRCLIYSTRQTCPDVNDYPNLCRHLSQFRPILEARRETRSGSNRWWHLHWPRDETIWQAPKLIALQMAVRPSFAATLQPTYVPFSANVFVPATETGEDLHYLCGVLNSRVLWAWFQHYGKRRGVGLELNGHLLQKAPIRRIDFANPSDVQSHDTLVKLVRERMAMEMSRLEDPTIDARQCSFEIERTESQIDELVQSLYGLNLDDASHVAEVTGLDCANNHTQ